MKVLIIENETTKALLLQEYLSFYDCESIVSTTIERGVKLLNSESFSIVFVDYHLPDGKGTDVLQRFKGKSKNIRFILNTSDSEVNQKYKELGFDDRIDGYLSFINIFKTVEV